MMNKWIYLLPVMLFSLAVNGSSKADDSDDEDVKTTPKTQHTSKTKAAKSDAKKATKSDDSDDDDSKSSSEKKPKSGSDSEDEPSSKPKAKKTKDKSHETPPATTEDAKPPKHGTIKGEPLTEQQTKILDDALEACESVITELEEKIKLKDDKLATYKMRKKAAVKAKKSVLDEHHKTYDLKLAAYGHCIADITTTSAEQAASNMTEHATKVHDALNLLKESLP